MAYGTSTASCKENSHDSVMLKFKLTKKSTSLFLEVSVNHFIKHNYILDGVLIRVGHNIQHDDQFDFDHYYYYWSKLYRSREYKF